MKAAVFTKYGLPDVLQINEVAKPVPKENEVLIKIHATTVTAVDSIFRSGKHFFARIATGPVKPKVNILGTEFAGVVEEVGENVILFNKGDKVFGDSSTISSTHAEYISLPENDPISIIPSGLSFEEAAAIPYGSLTSLPFLRDNGKIQSGQQVLIIGASGSVGSFAVQFAKYYGAEVTRVCGNSNVDLVKSLGADKVIDYSKEDFTNSSQKYDIIFDTVGKSSFSKSKNSLKKNGKYLTTVIGFSILFQMLMTSKSKKKKAIIAFTGLRKKEEKSEDLTFIKNLIEDGNLKPVIDKEYTFDQIIDAHRYVDQGHKKGNVVIKI